MKKVICLFSLMLALVLMNTNCTKPTDDNPIVQTLRQKYPDWKNLTWVSTDGANLTSTYPRLNISITAVGDTVKTNQPMDNGGYSMNGWYGSIGVQGTNVTFSIPYNNTMIDFVCTNVVINENAKTVTLYTGGLLTAKHTYVLKIN
jgi:hypothetical protein